MLNIVSWITGPLARRFVTRPLWRSMVMFLRSYRGIHAPYDTIHLSNSWPTRSFFKKPTAELTIVSASLTSSSGLIESVPINNLFTIHWTQSVESMIVNIIDVVYTNKAWFLGAAFCMRACLETGACIGSVSDVDVDAIASRIPCRTLTH